MKTHEGQKRLREAGFEFERQSGTSHQIWKRGTEMIILVMHKGKELNKASEKQIRMLELELNQGSNKK